MPSVHTSRSGKTAAGSRMDRSLHAAALAAPGYMPDDEGLALYDAALQVGERGPLLEIGSYCGKSAIYIGAAAREAGSVLFSVDHHRGNEEQQPGEGWHDRRFVDDHGRVDTLPVFRRTIEDAGLTDVVVGMVGVSAVIAQAWRTSLSFLFIDGGHSREAATADYEGWAPSVIAGGVLAIHDVFEDPAEGGRPPYEIFRRAVDSGTFEEISKTGSLRILRRSG